MRITASRERAVSNGREPCASAEMVSSTRFLLPSTKADNEMEATMYIGIGTIVLIIVLVLIFR